MNTIILSCPTLKGELLSALREADAHTPVYFMPERLHSNPKELHEYVQNMLDSFVNVDRIIVCVSGCGGGTLGLKATNSELVLPKTLDCLDILLTDESTQNINRPKHGIFLTASWMEFMKKSTIDLDRLTAERGKEAAEETLKKLYSGFNRFYIIDTGAYDIAPVKAYIQPLVDLLDGTLEVLPGKYGVLRKMAQGKIDDDFWVIAKGESVPMDAYKKPDIL